MKLLLRAILILGMAVGCGGCGTRQATSRNPESRSPSNSAQTATFEKVRGPAVAGMFYPRDETALSEAVEKYLAKANPEPVKNLRGLVCPHAGYEYSGPTAAIGYKLLVGRDIGTVFVLAPTHTSAFEGASIPDVEAYETPLGMIPLSPKAAELAGVKPFVVKGKCDVQRPLWWRRAPKELPAFGEDTPHSWEHSLEVQLPFLQKTLEDFQIVPVVFGQHLDTEAVARALVEQFDERTLVVVSSDLSHYYPYERAKGLDAACVKAICSLNVEWMQGQEACGKVPILTLMHIARQKGWKAKLLDYRNSGDTAGDKSRVVGYAAIAFYEPDGVDVAEQTGKQGGQNEFTPAQRKYLLQLARKTVDGIVTRRTSPELDAKEIPKEFSEPRAVFVTLKREGKLRGCIGNIFPRLPLYRAVVDSARSAAVRDPRFPPVRPQELDQIEVEVSVLTIPRQLKFESPEELLEKLRPHVDGVVLRVGRKQSTYLPQVWEQIPDKEEFLGHLAEKAGLSSSDWKKPEASVLVYQAEAFQESQR